MVWIDLIKEVGPYIGIMFFFIWRDYRREERMEAQNEELNQFIRTELLELIDQYNKAVRNDL